MLSQTPAATWFYIKMFLNLEKSVQLYNFDGPKQNTY